MREGHVEFPTVDIDGNIEAYLGERRPLARYASFDYCFNYFRGFHARGRLDEILAPDHQQMSCLQLGFYLGSWGMFRGGSQLIKRSLRHYIQILESLVASDPRMWELDVDRYDDEGIELLLGEGRRIRQSFGHPVRDVLLTKVLLGVVGCVPAFDRFFCDGFHATTFGQKALRRVGAFYTANKQVIDRHRIATLDFATGGETRFTYTRAKIIDMVFFIEGGGSADRVD